MKKTIEIVPCFAFMKLEAAVGRWQCLPVKFQESEV